ncbi:MAG: galactonate dehydratase [Thermoproteota archaeon]|nr:galactonate dehydratase [Thermoproteota archaeon]
MKITGIETFLVTERWLFVRIDTDEGISGVGESGFWGYPRGTLGVLDTVEKYIIGKNPLQMEHYWQYIYRNNHFRGAALGGALSALDIALWDIAGKYYEAPVYQLLGGKTRNKVRLYIHVRGETAEELAEDAVRAVKKGFTAVRFSPFPKDFENMTKSELISSSVSLMKRVREAVGEKIDICVDVHGRLPPSEAIVLGKELEKYRLLFYEDPTVQDSADAVAQVARGTSIPIATGERLHTIYEFKELLERRAVAMVRPDLCLAGGLTQCKKIAALAEAFQVGVVPHNPLSPISTAACVQLDACIPNFVIQEYMGEDKPPKSEIVKTALKLDKGSIIIPDTPGIGIELEEKALKKYPYTVRVLDTTLRDDGSVVDV